GNALTAASSSAVSESVSRSSTIAGIALVVSPVGTFSGVAARAAPGTSAEPHWPQKLLPSGFSCPQLVQNGIASAFVFIAPKGRGVMQSLGPPASRYVEKYGSRHGPC